MRADTWASRGRRFGAAAALGLGFGLALLTLGACQIIDIEVVREVAFGETVPGLPPGQPWTTLPVGIWMQESGIEARAISACLDPACAPRAAIALLSARGPEGDRLEALAAHPERLVQALSGARKVRPGAKTRPSPTEARAAPFRSGGFSGFSLRLARRDGAAEAAGVAITARRGGLVSVILVVAPSEAEAQSLAGGVAGAAT